MLEQVARGVRVAVREAREYGKKYAGARKFSDRLIEVMRRGVGRMGFRVR